MIKEEVDAEDRAEVVSRWTGIPVNRMLQSEREKLLTMEAELHRRVVGQDEAIEVVSDAVRCAVPSLDLVLTPNGFGIVSNTNVAPASKERVERLIASLLDMRDKAVEQLLNQLPLMQSWTASAQCRWFTATLFPNIDLVSLCGFTEHRWEKYLELRSKVLDIEDSLAEEYFSHELMAVLRQQALATSANESYAWIVARMKPQIVDFIHDKPIAQQKIVDIVNFIRNNPEEFPEWHNSDTAKLFSPPKFENKITNKGYWF